MKEIKLDIFEYQELPESAKMVARESYRETREFPFFDDYMKSIEYFCADFGVKVKDYNIGAYQHSYIRTDVTNENFRNLRLSDYDKDLMPSGFCADTDLRYTFYDGFKQTGSALFAFAEALESIQNVMKNDVESFFSDQEIDDQLMNDDVHYTEKGVAYEGQY